DGLGWTWVYARLRPEGPALLAHNFVISEAEAWCLRQQLAAEAPPGPPEPFGLGLDFPGASIGAGGDLGVGAGPSVGLGVGPGVGSGVDLGVGSGLGDDVGANVGVNIGLGLGLGVNVGCGLGA
ncbi:NPAS4 protein, partial [Fregata magnificens]|nr:NPAS4 protein [Fregata magnificens]